MPILWKIKINKWWLGNSSGLKETEEQWQLNTIYDPCLEPRLVFLFKQKGKSEYGLYIKIIVLYQSLISWIW